VSGGARLRLLVVASSVDIVFKQQVHPQYYNRLRHYQRSHVQRRGVQHSTGRGATR